MARGWSLRARFVLVAVAGLVPLLGVVLFVLYESIDHGRDQLLGAQSKTAELVANVLAATIDENEWVLGELASVNDVRKLDAEKTKEVLEQTVRLRPSLYSLFVVDVNGSFVTHAGVDPIEFESFPSFQTGVEQALNYGELGVSNKLVATDAEVIALVTPIRAKDGDTGAPIGAVGGLLSVQRLKDSVLPFASGDTEIAIASEGEVIAAQPDEPESDSSGRLAQPIAQAVAGEIGWDAFTDAVGAERLAAYHPVPEVGWAAIVTHPTPATYAPNRMLIERGLIALALAVVATLILVMLLGEWIARPLRTLTAQATALSRGDFSIRPTPGGGGEVRLLGEAVREMAARLTSEVRDLEDSSKAGGAHADLMRDLNRRTIRLQEDERRRLAGEIHDAVAPLITGALYQARALRLAAPAEVRGGPNGLGSIDVTKDDSLAPGLDAISDLLSRATEELHGVIFSLRPPDLDDIGVVAAIERYMAQVQRAGLRCRLEVVGDEPNLTPEVRLAVYRIVQEALHNSLRHSAADEAEVRLDTTDAMLKVSIRDNGAGFNPEVAQRPTALGLLSMRERAAAIGATFAVASRPGDGTTITIERRGESESAPETSHDLVPTTVMESSVLPEHPTPAAPSSAAGAFGETVPV